MSALTKLKLDRQDEWLREVPWSNNGGYLCYQVNGKTMYIHQFIRPGYAMIDHKNGDVMDNRRDNLRPCTVSQNGANRGKTINNTSGWKGVYKRTDRLGGKLWYARLMKPSKHLGYYNCPTRAALAYDRGAIERWGEFAKTNILENG